MRNLRQFKQTHAEQGWRAEMRDGVCSCANYSFDNLDINLGGSIPAERKI
ncbi:MAG: hypothetical protein HKN33_10070 [Pyrinomonadaceae bacterium]|nr:hypothetical protein [Pyrinomonadaceae bacterium]